jgi:hypothetical protein
MIPRRDSLAGTREDVVSEPNPYEAPRALSTPPRPFTARERVVAARWLQIRDQGGYTLGLFYRWNALGYLFTLAYFGAVLGLLAVLQLWMLFMLILGLWLGVLGRDLGWARAQARTWLIQEQVMEWDKVRRLADGKPLV